MKDRDKKIKEAEQVYREAQKFERQWAGFKISTPNYFRVQRERELPWRENYKNKVEAAVDKQKYGPRAKTHMKSSLDLPPLHEHPAQHSKPKWPHTQKGWEDHPKPVTHTANRLAKLFPPQWPVDADLGLKWVSDTVSGHHALTVATSDTGIKSHITSFLA